MKEDVTVLVHGTQRQPGTGEEQMKTKAPGRYLTKGLTSFVRYEEIPEEDGHKHTTILRMEPGRLVMTKKGAVQAQLEFVPGKTTEGRYETPYGVLMLQVTTTGLSLIENPDEVRVSLQYSLGMDGDPLSENELEIWIK